MGRNPISRHRHRIPMRLAAIDRSESTILRLIVRIRWRLVVAGLTVLRSSPRSSLVSLGGRPAAGRGVPRGLPAIARIVLWWGVGDITIATGHTSLIRHGRGGNWRGTAVPCISTAPIEPPSVVGAIARSDRLGTGSIVRCRRGARGSPVLRHVVGRTASGGIGHHAAVDGSVVQLLRDRRHVLLRLHRVMQR